MISALIELNRVNGEKWRLNPANICGLHDTSHKGSAATTVLMVGNVTVTVHETEAEIRDLMSQALGRRVAILKLDPRPEPEAAAE